MRLLSMSGFVPEHICDTIRFTSYSGTHKISHFCGYASDFLSQVLEDESIDGAVFPRSCDSCRVLPDYLSDCGKFIHQIAVPARQDESAVNFLAHSIKQYQMALEKHYGGPIGDISERITIINERNHRIGKLYGELTDMPYGEYIGFLHKLLHMPLYDQLNEIQTGHTDKQNANKPVHKYMTHEKSVYLIGSFLSNVDMADTIEDAGMKIIGDNLTESKRLFSAAEVLKDGDLYQNIAQSILNNQLSPTQNYFEKLIRTDLEEMKHKNIDGVIFITQKYCEPYDYLFSIYKKVLEQENIPSLQVTLSDTTDNKKSSLALETFKDIL